MLDLITKTKECYGCKKVKTKDQYYSETLLRCIEYLAHNGGDYFAE